MALINICSVYSKTVDRSPHKTQTLRYFVKMSDVTLTIKLWSVFALITALTDHNLSIFFENFFMESHYVDYHSSKRNHLTRFSIVSFSWLGRYFSLKLAKLSRTNWRNQDTTWLEINHNLFSTSSSCLASCDLISSRTFSKRCCKWNEIRETKLRGLWFLSSHLYWNESQRALQ